jgi:DNA (cytosine-5)-methyltransferase 1
MTAYYNEIDPFAAEWLRQLIKAGQIAPGVVDERSIVDVKPEDLREFTQCHFFAGIGTWSYALRLAGWPDDRSVWTGSPPCQPFSTAGNQLGKDDERHLAPHWLKLVSESHPTVLFGEQVAAAINHGWFDDLQSHLEAEDYACGMVVLPACGVGAPHIRQRQWIVAERLANDSGQGLQGCIGGGPSVEERQSGGYSGECGGVGHWEDADWLYCRDGKWRPVEPGTFPLAHGAPARMGRLRGYGNGIVAQVAQEIIESYLQG